MSVYQLPSPPTQQPINHLPYSGMAKSNNQTSTPKEGIVNNLPGVSTVTSSGQQVQVTTNASVSGIKQEIVTKKKSGILSNHPLKIDTSIVKKGFPVSPTSQSSSPQPTSASSTTNKSPRPKSNNNNTFVHKLYQMLSDPKQSKYINWNDTGYSFTIRNVQGFSRNILPLHFRHNNFSSFVRQLNMYGFHKVNKSTPKGSENQVWEFFHPKFIRGKPHLIEEIKRKQLENESYRANLLLEQTRALVRHNSLNSLNKRNSSNLVNGTTAPQLVPSHCNPMVNQPISNPEMAAPQPVFIQATEGIPSSNVTVNVTTNGEAVLIDPASIQNTQIVQQVTVPSSNYGVIQVPTQTIPINEVTTSPVTTVPQAMAMGNVIQQNHQTVVEHPNVVVNGQTILHQEISPVATQQAKSPMDNDVFYNIQLLQMQNQEMNQRINDLQANVNNLMNTYNRRMDMQQNMIQQLMNSTQQHTTTICSVDQGISQMVPQGTTIVGNTQSPVQQQPQILQSPVLVQPNGQEQKVVNQTQGTPMNNQISNGITYPTQTIYY